MKPVCPEFYTAVAVQQSQESFTNPCIQFVQQVVKNCVVCLIKLGRHVLLFHIESAGQQIDLMVQRINMKRGPYAASCPSMFMRPEPEHTVNHFL